MPTYVQLIKWTQAGIETVKDAPERTKKIRDMLKSVGAEQKAHYFVFGKYDMVSIIEAPSDEVMAKIALGIGKMGRARAETLKAFSEAEGLEIIKGLP